MLKTCSKCGKLHDFNYQCHKNRSLRKSTQANSIRNTYRWNKKSLEIRDRDKNLCRCCLADIYGTQYVYNYEQLEVHHIIPIEEDVSLAFVDDNLITLCIYHHKLADKGVIPRNILSKLVDIDCNFNLIRQEVEAKYIPPTF